MDGPNLDHLILIFITLCTIGYLAMRVYEVREISRASTPPSEPHPRYLAVVSPSNMYRGRFEQSLIRDAATQRMILRHSRRVRGYDFQTWPNNGGGDFDIRSHINGMAAYIMRHARTVPGGVEARTPYGMSMDGMSAPYTSDYANVALDMDNYPESVRATLYAAVVSPYILRPPERVFQRGMYAFDSPHVRRARDSTYRQSQGRPYYWARPRSNDDYGDSEDAQPVFRSFYEYDSPSPERAPVKTRQRSFRDRREAERRRSGEWGYHASRDSLRDRVQGRGFRDENPADDVLRQKSQRGEPSRGDRKDDRRQSGHDGFSETGGECGRTLGHGERRYRSRSSEDVHDESRRDEKYRRRHGSSDRHRSRSHGYERHHFDDTDYSDDESDEASYTGMKGKGEEIVRDLGSRGGSPVMM